jgi:hypothetical protein
LIGVNFDDKQLAGFEAWKSITHECHWFYPFLDFCLVSDKPTEIHRDERNNLHNLTGPALGYRDGWGVYAAHGVRLSSEIIEHPETITVEQIDHQPNAEIRRVMVERYGMERFLTDAGAKLIHGDECGQLYRREMGDDEPIVAVRVVNSTPEPDGTRHVYFLRVPPTTRTARAGVAWTFEMTEEEYQPAVQS